MKEGCRCTVGLARGDWYGRGTMVEEVTNGDPPPPGDADDDEAEVLNMLERPSRGEGFGEPGIMATTSPAAGERGGWEGSLSMTGDEDDCITDGDVVVVGTAVADEVGTSSSLISASSASFQFILLKLCGLSESFLSGLNICRYALRSR